MSSIRISNKENATIGNTLYKRSRRRVTLFDVHGLRNGAYMYFGSYHAAGWNASDAACESAYRDAQAERECAGGVGY